MFSACDATRDQSLPGSSGKPSEGQCAITEKNAVVHFVSVDSFFNGQQKKLFNLVQCGLARGLWRWPRVWVAGHCCESGGHTLGGHPQPPPPLYTPACVKRSVNGANGHNHAPHECVSNTAIHARTIAQNSGVVTQAQVGSTPTPSERYKHGSNEEVDEKEGRTGHTPPVKPPPTPTARATCLQRQRPDFR